MLATIDRPAETEASNLSPLIYDGEGCVIQATVIISRGEEPGTYHHDVYPLSAVGPVDSNWTVIWTLAPSQGISAQFVGDGIIVPKPGTSLPDGVTNLNPRGISSIKSQLTFTHNVTDVNVIRYDLDLHVQETEHNVKLKRSEDIIIDPTISVVREPLG